MAHPRVSLPLSRHGAGGEEEEQPVFFYDLASPECYLAAERVLHALPVLAEWQPVHLPEACTEQIDRSGLERRAAAQGLQPVRWPRAWPPDSGLAMHAATYAKQIGRAVAFSQAAFRQAFAGGRDLADPDTVLIAGAACEMHPTALLKSAELRSVRAALTRTTEAARAAGVRTLPAVRLASGEVFAGEHALHAAAGALAAA